jgi:4-amino-4-deoxy-L-arabinose transferase-like glycosyltransferase
LTAIFVHNPTRVRWLAFTAILVVGVFARTWQFNSLPPGLNADEASIGVDAYYLAHYGIDRNGVSWPVSFVSWGSGQNALYGYMLVPFILMLGLSPLVVRLPMLLTGILSLPLIYYVSGRTLGQKAAPIGMLLLAISPWHVMLSRWGLESNILPFMFLLAFSSLLWISGQKRGLALSGILFGLCLYAYGTAYAVVPAFLVMAGVVLVRGGTVPIRRVLGGGLAFVVVALPIWAFLVVNSLGFKTLRVGPVTIPRLPSTPRYEETTLLGAGASWTSLSGNLRIGLEVLATENDGLPYNQVEPFGYLYHIGLIGGIFGAALFAFHVPAYEERLVLAWLLACLLVPVMQASNINRLNIIFIPMLICVAAVIMWLISRAPVALPITVGLLMLLFGAFTVAYHGDFYRRVADWKFNQGLVPALLAAERKPSGTVCVTDRINMPYIFALFTARPDPRDFTGTAVYKDPAAAFRQVASFDRFLFGSENCESRDGYTYVLTAEEVPPRLGNRYTAEFFDNFVVYSPRP